MHIRRCTEMLCAKTSPLCVQRFVQRVHSAFFPANSRRPALESAASAFPLERDFVQRPGGKERLGRRALPTPRRSYNGNCRSLASLQLHNFFTICHAAPPMNLSMCFPPGMYDTKNEASASICTTEKMRVRT